jgi:hypothetical protein
MTAQIVGERVLLVRARAQRQVGDCPAQAIRQADLVITRRQGHKQVAMELEH